MDILTADSLAEALTLCSQHSQFKVGIIFDNKRVMTEFIKDIEEIGDTPGIVRKRLSTNGALLGFYNGSCIKICTYTPANMRGHRFNQVLLNFDGDLTDDALSNIRNVIFPYVNDETQNAFDEILFATEFGVRKAMSGIMDEFVHGTKTCDEDIEDDSSEELDDFLNQIKVREEALSPND